MPGLEAVSARLGALSKFGAPVPSSSVAPGASQLDVLSAVDTLVTYLEGCTMNLQMTSFEQLTERLERVAGVAPSASPAVAGASMDQLEGVVRRLEAVTA